MISKQILCDGHTLHAVVTPNDRPPLLMLHGVTRRWQTFLPLWSSLAERWEIHALDFRGHGESEQTAGGYYVCDYIEDVVAYIDSELQQPVVVYGHSLGAMVAAGTASKLRDCIAAVVMEDPPMQAMGQRIGDTSLLSFFTALSEFAGDQRSVFVIAEDLAEIRVHDPQRNTSNRLGDLRDPVSLRFTASCLKQLDPATLVPIVARDWLRGYSVDSVARNLKCPSLLLQADVSAGGMLSDEDAGLLEDLAVDLVRVKIPDCGHLIHWTHTTQLLNFVHGFLESSV